MIAHTETKDGVTLKIVLDDSSDTDSPVEYDEAVIFAVLHRRYENPARSKGILIRKPFGQGHYDFTTTEGLQAFEKANAHKTAPYAVFPLYMYDHGSTSYQCSEGGNPFSCPWDSGRVGLIALRKSDVGDPKKFPYLKQAQDICENYTAWANGEVYGYVIEDAEGNNLDSCWGFIGDPDGDVLAEGRAALESCAKEAREKAAREQETERPDMYPLNSANVALDTKNESNT